jgi:protein-tyrosine phosphatase
MEKLRILFVCMGNICRSPTAEGVARNIIENSELKEIVHVDSAGTHAYHTGEAPDPRARRAAAKRGVDLGRLRARQVEVEDFERFDLILAMDRENLLSLESYCPPDKRHKIELFMRYARRFEAEEVPDPYFGGEDGFNMVLDMVEDAAQGLVETLRRR